MEYNSALIKKREAFKQHMSRINKNKPKRYKVQIWGKAAIGKSPIKMFGLSCNLQGLGERKGMLFLMLVVSVYLLNLIGSSLQCFS